MILDFDGEIAFQFAELQEFAPPQQKSLPQNPNLGTLDPHHGKVESLKALHSGENLFLKEFVYISI